MVLETTERPKELTLVTIDEKKLWDENDPRHFRLGLPPSYINCKTNSEGTHDINLQTDSYIMVFTGPRGSGKTTLMTLFALRAVAYWGFRLVSNYEIECNIRKVDGSIVHVKSEPLDLYALLNFDNSYKDSLILLDEAPDIISHLAAMTWKNRLLNIFIRQLRKNHISMLLGAQQIELIDKSFRWQVDIICECSDASRKYGWDIWNRGKEILLRMLDNSGQWTGETWEQALYRQRNNFMDSKISEEDEDIGEDYAYHPRILWGEKGKTKPVFDSWVTHDVWESLRKVELSVQSQKVGDKVDEVYDFSRAWDIIEACFDEKSVLTREIYKSIPGKPFTHQEKKTLAMMMDECGVRSSRNGKYKYFKNCDRERLHMMMVGEG